MQLKPIKQYSFEELVGLSETELRVLLGRAQDHQDLLILGQVMKNSKKLLRANMKQLSQEELEPKKTPVQDSVETPKKPFLDVDVNVFSPIVRGMITRLHREWDDLSPENRQIRTKSIMNKMELEAEK